MVDKNDKGSRKIICLCGSTSFKYIFEKLQRELTLKGHIVLSPGVFSKVDHDIEKLLAEVHMDKIRMSDIVFIINKYKYIGSSTMKEIEYAKSLGKEIIYLEEPDKEINEED